MDNFIDLNRQKIKFAFKATSSVFLTFVLIIFVYSYLKGDNVSDISLLITVILGAGVVLPMFIIAIAYYEWYQKKAIRQRAFNLSPFDKLEEIGFGKYYVLTNSRFYFTEEVKRGEINDFDLICNVERNSPRKIDFRAITKDRQIDKREFKELARDFKKHNIEFEFGCLTKSYNLKKIQFNTAMELKTDLEQFTELLKKNGFEPLKENG